MSEEQANETEEQTENTEEKPEETNLTAKMFLELNKSIEGLSAQFTEVKAQTEKNKDVLDALIPAMNNGFGQFQQTAGKLEQLSRSNVGLLEFCSGVEKALMEKVELTHETLVWAVDSITSTKRKAQVDQAVKKGEIEPVDIVEKDSYLVAKETNDKGNLLSSRTQIFTNMLEEKLQEKIIGQKVGFKLELKGGNMLEVLEIYKPVPPKPPQVKPEEGKAPPEAPAVVDKK